MRIDAAKTARPAVEVSQGRFKWIGRFEVEVDADWCVLVSTQRGQYKVLILEVSDPRCALTANNDGTEEIQSVFVCAHKNCICHAGISVSIFLSSKDSILKHSPGRLVDRILCSRCMRERKLFCCAISCDWLKNA
jgi:hypothetical protein